MYKSEEIAQWEWEEVKIDVMNSGDGGSGYKHSFLDSSLCIRGSRGSRCGRSSISLGNNTAIGATRREDSKSKSRDNEVTNNSEDTEELKVTIVLAIVTLGNRIRSTFRVEETVTIRLSNSVKLFITTEPPEHPPESSRNEEAVDYCSICPLLLTSSGREDPHEAKNKEMIIVAAELGRSKGEEDKEDQ